MKMNRTVRDFQNALATLLEIKAFDKITVDQICAEALLHRSSFYRYFHDKYDLLEQLINTRLNQIVDEAATEDDFLQLTVSYLGNHKNVFRHLSGDSANSTFYTEMIRIISEVLLSQADADRQVKVSEVAKEIHESSNPELLSYVYGGAIIGGCYWWQMNNYDVPVQKVVDFVKQTVLQLSSASTNKQ